MSSPNSSPIIGGRATATLKSRVTELENQFLNLRDSWLADIRAELPCGSAAYFEAEGTSKIQEFDTMELFQEEQRAHKLKKDLSADIKGAVGEAENNIYTKLKVDLMASLKEDLKKEEEDLFLRLKARLLESIKEVKLKVVVDVSSKGTQVDEGDIAASDRSTDSISLLMLDKNAEDEESVSLLA